MLEFVSPRRRVEFPLNVILVPWTQPRPGGKVTWFCCCIKSIWQGNPNEIGNQVAVVKVIPNEDSNLEPMGLDDRAENPGETLLPFIVGDGSSLSTGADVTDPMDLDLRIEIGIFPAALIEQASEFCVVVPRGIKMRVDEHHRVGVVKHQGEHTKVFIDVPCETN